MRLFFFLFVQPFAFVRLRMRFLLLRRTLWMLLGRRGRRGRRNRGTLDLATTFLRVDRRRRSLNRRHRAIGLPLGRTRRSLRTIWRRSRSWRWSRLHRVWYRVGNILRDWRGWRGCRRWLGLRCCLWCSVLLLFSPRCHFGSMDFLFLFLLDLAGDFFRRLRSSGNLANRGRRRLLSSRSAHLRHIRPGIHNNLLRPSGYVPILPD